MLDVVKINNILSKVITDNTKIGVAVSGGGDSVSLLQLIINLTNPSNVHVLHFNHNLREEAESEELWVKNLTEKLGANFHSTTWHEQVDGNIQQLARRARYKFFYEVLKKEGLKAVALGHTKDDVAETFLMRMARGSGIAGLSSMSEYSDVMGVTVFRPLLSSKREELREYLESINQSWIEDPSNQNDKFLRVRVRKLKPFLDEAGISSDSIVASASSLLRANEALEEIANDFFEKNVVKTEGYLKVSNEIFDIPEEVALRVLSNILLKVNPADGMAPRTSKRQRLLTFMKTSQLPVTLGGVKIEHNCDGFAFLIEKTNKK